MTTIINKTLRRWWSADPGTMGAALAFYTLLSLAPLFIFMIVMFEQIVGLSTLQDRVLLDVHRVAGPQAAGLMATIADQIHSRTHGATAGIISFIIATIGGLGMFDQLKVTLDRILNKKAEPTSVIKYIQKKLLVFITILVLGALMVTAVFVTTLIQVVLSAFDLAHIAAIPWLLTNIVSLVLAIIFVTFTYRYLPSERVQWRAAFVGSIFTVILFIVGRFGIDLYFQHVTSMSSYGAAGTIVAILLWVYYSSQIFFLGAAYTAVINDKLQ